MGKLIIHHNRVTPEAAEKLVQLYCNYKWP